MKLHIPRDVEQIICTLKEHGYEAYAVGGCVRDTLLLREPEDWDITTSAKPEEMKAVFGRTIDTGIAHGTVTILRNHIGYEVTTYRIDGEYEDGRHPKSVEFTANLSEDLKRRDFTINAMAYSHETGIVDEFGGREDLRLGMIRCVGCAADRFHEDALRMLRAVRFAAQLCFEIEDETKRAMIEHAPNLSKISKERIQVELTKLLLSSNPEVIQLLYDLGIAAYLADGFERQNEALSSMSQLPSTKHIRWAGFLHAYSSEQAQALLKKLKMDKDTIKKVGILTDWCHQKMKADKVEIRKVMSQMEPDLFDELLSLRKIMGFDDDSEQILKLSNEIKEAEDCVSLKTLALSGNDLIEAGIKPGKDVGKTLKNLLDLVLEHPELNTKEALKQCLFSSE